MRLEKALRAGRWANALPSDGLGAQARGLVRIEGIALASQVTNREDKKDRS
jgi:hypothetical protein